MGGWIDGRGCIMNMNINVNITIVVFSHSTMDGGGIGS